MVETCDVSVSATPQLEASTVLSLASGTPPPMEIHGALGNDLNLQPNLLSGRLWVPQRHLKAT